MRVLDLFSGTKSISNVFKSHGCDTYSIDNDTAHKDIDLYRDIQDVYPNDILKNFGQPDVIWASPPCTTYSIAAISHHRVRDENGNLSPKSDFAKFSDDLVKHTIYLISCLQPKYWFIENPRGGLRKMDFMKHLPRYTVTYCQYGDKRMKPTDIWTNHPNPKFRPICKNGDDCHESAPRGSRTGTQGLCDAKERSIIPYELCEHIYTICAVGSWQLSGQTRLEV